MLFLYKRKFQRNVSPPSSATYSRWFLARGFFCPEDGGDMFLRNVGSYKNYTTPHPRKRHSSGISMLMEDMPRNNCFFQVKI
jgi:hypothetical protein